MLLKGVWGDSGGRLRGPPFTPDQGPSKGFPDQQALPGDQQQALTNEQIKKDIDNEFIGMAI